MTDSEITTTILRQIRDLIEKTNVGLERTNVSVERLEQRMLVSETVLRDVYGQLLALNRHVKSRNDAAIDDLRKRVTKLEKKVG